MSTTTRSTRRQAKKASITEVTPKKEELTSQQISRMEDELVKFPSPSVYYKKKLATRFAKEFGLNDKIILDWLNENGKRDFGRVKITPVPAQPKIEIKKEIVEKNVQVAKKSSSEIQCIDIESDTDDNEILLNESNANDSVTLLEKHSDKPVIKVKPTQVAIKGTTSKNENDKGNSIEASKEMKVKYDDLLKEYKDKVDIVKNLENQIPRMISEFKKYVEDMETKHKKNIQEKEEELKKLQDDGVKKATRGETDKLVKNLQKELKDKETALLMTKKELANQKEIVVTDRNAKDLKEQLKKTETELDAKKKEFNEHKTNQEAMDNRYRKLIKKQEKDLDRANQDSQDLLNKMKKMKEDYSKKNPQHSKELNELKDMNKKLKKNMDLSENEAKKVLKDKEEAIKMHETLKKKMSKLEEDLKKKTKSNDDMKKELDDSRQTNKRDKAKYQSDLIDIQAELKNVKNDFNKKEDKLLEKNEMLREKIEQLQNQQLESKNKSKDAENEVVEMKRSISTLETEKKALLTELEGKKKEIAANKTVIFECKAEIENAKTLIKSSTKDISDRNNIISEQKKKNESLEKVNQDMTVVLQELKKEVERKKFSSDKLQEITEKVKEKEYALLKLRNVVFDKDNLISAKDAEIQRLSSRIHEIQKDFDKQMESRGFEEINNQNNLRHQLLVQQQEMRKILLAEQDVLKHQMAEVKVNYENILKAAIKEAEKIQETRENKLHEIIQQKKELLVKVKKTLLYKSSEGHGEETSSVTAGPRAALGYNWPLVYKYVEEEQITEIRSTKALESLLQWTTPVSRSIGVLVSGRQGIKRGSEDGKQGTRNKRFRAAPPALMLSFCWPVALYHKKTLTLDIEVDLCPLSLTTLPMSNVEQGERKKGTKRNPEYILEHVPAKKPKLGAKSEEKHLMITYSWPVAVYEEPKRVCIEPRIKFPSILITVSVPPRGSFKRKAEGFEKPLSAKKMRLLMITYERPPLPSAGPALLCVPDEKLKEDEPDTQPELISFASIPSYKYKIVSPAVNTKCLSSPSLRGQRVKVTKRSYHPPKYQKVSKTGVKRSFLDFLEDLSFDEIQDVRVAENSDSDLDLPVIVTKPANKKPRFSASPILIKNETTLPQRRMSQSLKDETEFFSEHDLFMEISDFVIDSILVNVF